MRTRTPQRCMAPPKPRFGPEFCAAPVQDLRSRFVPVLRVRSDSDRRAHLLDGYDLRQELQELLQEGQPPSYVRAGDGDYAALALAGAEAVLFGDKLSAEEEQAVRAGGSVHVHTHTHNHTHTHAQTPTHACILTQPDVHACMCATQSLRGLSGSFPGSHANTPTAPWVSARAI